MDENTIKIIHELSARTEMILWIVSAGFSITFSLMFLMWNYFNNKFDKVDKQFDKVYLQFDKVDQQIEKVREEIKDIDRRLCRIEGAMSNKDCCMLKDDRIKHKAE